MAVHTRGEEPQRLKPSSPEPEKLLICRHRGPIHHNIFMTATTRNILPNVVALVIRIGFWGPIYHSYDEEPPTYC